LLAVEDLIMWRDPKKTGIVVGVATAVFLFFYFLKMPLISLVLYSAGTFVLLVTVWARFGQSVGKCVLPFSYLMPIHSHALAWMLFSLLN
jgi:hypothetical protein